MSNTLAGILNLVGQLDDSPGEHTPRERFRRHLNQIHDVDQIYEYLVECLRTSGPQYNRALQDLVNHFGHFLGFDVTFGRYQGAAGQLGFDGHWMSPTGFHVVVEVKTPQLHSVKANTLVRYVGELIGEGLIPGWNRALGLYVVEPPDHEISLLHESIAYEDRYNHLRIIYVNSLASLAGMVRHLGLTHHDVLAVLWPSGPFIHPIVDMMDRLTQKALEYLGDEDHKQQPLPVPTHAEPQHWLTPATKEDDRTPEDIIATLLGEAKVYAFGLRTAGRKNMKPGDWICFYAAQNGVVAHARIASTPERKTHPEIAHPDEFPWLVNLASVRLYLHKPVVLDAVLRGRLDAFHGKDPNKTWAWFVQTTRLVTEHDFKILTGQQAPA